MTRVAWNLYAALLLLSVATHAVALTLDDLPVVDPTPLSEGMNEGMEAVSEERGHVPTLAVVSLGPSSAAAMTAAVFFPGAGHFYVGGEEAKARGVGFLFGELAALTVFVVGSQTILETHYFGPDEERMRAPAAALVGLLIFIPLKISELVDAGRMADKARANLARQRPMQPLAHGSSALDSAAPGTLVSLRVASF
jgi:hypothetical protein